LDDAETVEEKMNSPKDALKQVPLFSDLTDGELDILSEVVQVKNFDKSETIIHRYDEGDSFFAMISGKVKVVLTDDEGKEFIVKILQPAEFFGEISLLDGEPRSASVVAIEPTEAMVLHREDFLDQLKKHPEVAIKVMKVLGRRLRHSNENIESLVFLDVCGRLARILLDMANDTGTETEEGIEIKVEQRRAEMASLVGTTRETLTRALKTLETMGYIVVKRNSFVITSTHGLRSRVY